MNRHPSVTFLFSLSLLLLCTSLPAKEKPKDTKAPEEYPTRSMNGLPLIFSENFETGQASHWEPTDETAWRIVKQGMNSAYTLTKKRSDYNPPFRSPYNQSILKNVSVKSFVLDAQMQSTHPDYNHRDLCLFFGKQDEAHFYYVHLGKKMDDHANNIFIVNGSARKRISEKTTDGTNWDDNWHHVRVIRDIKSGSINIYFDDMEKPVMTANDKNFLWGRVGLGSFDDTGTFDDILLFGEIDEESH